MLALQAHDVQRSHLVSSSTVPHPYSMNGNYYPNIYSPASYYAANTATANHHADNLANANHCAGHVSTAPYDENLYSSEFTPEITPHATPEIEPAALFSPYFSFDIRSPTASPLSQRATPCSPRTTGASLHSPLAPSYAKTPSPITTTSAPPPPSPPPHTTTPASRGRTSSTSVEQALEIARNSREGAADPTVQRILERALAETWARVELMQGAYLMTCGEFAVFNFFQDRFMGNDLAVMARRRYWEGTTAGQ